MNSLTYREAAVLLNKNFASIARAGGLGVFTPLPMSTTRSHYVAEEQVKLFIGKRRLSLHSLSSAERTEWFRIKDEIEGHGPKPPTPFKPVGYDLEQVLTGLASRMERTGAALAETIAKFSVPKEWKGDNSLFFRAVRATEIAPLVERLSYSVKRYLPANTSLSAKDIEERIYIMSATDDKMLQVLMLGTLFNTMLEESESQEQENRVQKQEA